MATIDARVADQAVAVAAPLRARRAVARRRAAVASLAAVVAGAVVLVGGGADATVEEADGQDPPAEEVVVVSEGETLWGLAPDGVQPQAWAADVAERNDVRPEAVRTGSALRVPEGAGEG